MKGGVERGVGEGGRRGGVGEGGGVERGVCEGGEKGSG